MIIWHRKGYQVTMVDFSYDLKHFEVIVDGEVKYNICPKTIKDMEQIIEALNSGEDVYSWKQL